MSKPNTSTAMKLLIEQIKEALPFEKPEHEICEGKCVGCAKKNVGIHGKRTRSLPMPIG